MWRIAAAALSAAGIACAAAPAAEQLQTIAPGVRIFGAHLGGLTLDPARARIEAALERPLAIVYRGQVLSVSPQELGARASVENALRSALSARAHSRVELRMDYSKNAVASYVEGLARLYNRSPRPAKVVGATARGPVIREEKIGLAVEQQTLRAALAEQLMTGARRPLVLLMDAVLPKRTAERIGPVIVINRSTNRLELYSSTKLVRTFPVATGQAIYPTPQGVFQIVKKEVNPWWYPPTYDAWAKGLKPVPPGPWNPLGTRWMGLSAPGVGIHGTDADTSIGYSLSHGCIRMHVPDAEWLFSHVALGTPVVIL